MHEIDLPSVAGGKHVRTFWDLHQVPGEHLELLDQLLYFLLLPVHEPESCPGILTHGLKPGPLGKPRRRIFDLYSPALIGMNRW